MATFFCKKHCFFGIGDLQPLDEAQNLQVVVYKGSMVWHDVAPGWVVGYLQTLQNVDLRSYKNFLIALYFFAIKNRVRAHQHKIFLLTFAVELEWWC